MNSLKHKSHPLLPASPAPISVRSTLNAMKRGMTNSILEVVEKDGDQVNAGGKRKGTEVFSLQCPNKGNKVPSKLWMVNGLHNGDL